MKNLTIAILTALTVTTTFAQNAKHSNKKDIPAKQVSSEPAPLIPPTPPHIPKGPTGFGSLKIGMSKEAVEALQESDGVYLNSPLGPYEDKNYTPRPGIDKYTAKLQFPLSKNPLEAVLTFTEGQLISMFIKLDPDTGIIDILRKQISEKYGEGSVENNRKEEQCIYKNGANFKVPQGSISTKWTEVTQDNLTIETTVSDFVFEFCPTNLRYGSIGPAKLHSISISKKAQRPQTSPANTLF